MADETSKQSWETRVREAASHAEEDVRKVIAYINDEVMPDVRRNSSSALRAAAAELQRLAERLEEARKTPPTPPGA